MSSRCRCEPSIGSLLMGAFDQYVSDAVSESKYLISDHYFISNTVQIGVS
jgi:hypothetical protein